MRTTQKTQTKNQHSTENACDAVLCKHVNSWASPGFALHLGAGYQRRVLNAQREENQMPKRKDPALVKSETLTIKIPKDLKDRLFFQAMRRALDMSTFARMLIAEGLNSYDERSREPHKKKEKRT